MIKLHRTETLRAKDFDLRDEIERFFTQFSQWKRPSVQFEKAWRPFCDVYESEQYVRIVVEIAGVTADDIEIMLEGRRLLIRGKRPRYRSKEREFLQQMEVNFGSFERVLELACEVDADKAVARSKNGFLEIVLPKTSPCEVTGIPIAPAREEGEGET
ncbi:MAG: Hsp20/alpha crystallin family protein [Candidatus Geothermincolia bacterium]